MAQGGLKKRSDKFVPTKSKPSHKRKPLGPRKRGQYIAPKKAKSVKAGKLKKELQKRIGQSIEQEITQRAKQGGTEFRVLSAPSSSSSAASSSSSTASKATRSGSGGQGKGAGQSRQKTKN